MRLSFVTDTGDTYQVEVDPQMEMQDIMALLEAEVFLACSAWTFSATAEHDFVCS